MPKEEVLFKLAVFEEEINKLEQQMQIIEQQVLEMQGLYSGLEEMEKSKEKQMWANLGKNIFIKTELQDKNLLVDIGNRTFVKKSISETLKLIEEQLIKLIEAKNKVIGKLQEVQQQMEEVVEDAQREEK